jgi:hypothetical protein
MIDLGGTGRIAIVDHYGRPKNKPNWEQALAGTACVSHLTGRQSDKK